ERGILAEDRRLKVAQSPARLDSELAREPAARRLQGIERLGLPPRPVEREHALRAQALPAGAQGDERVDLADQRGVSPECAVGAVSGGRSPQRESMSRSLDTTSPTFRSRTASSARCFAPPSGTGPSAAAASSGPRIRNSISLPRP